MYKHGFTLVEVLVAISLVAIIGAASYSFAMPALSQFACYREKENAVMVIERARNIAQFSKVGNVRIKFTSNGYEIMALGNDYLNSFVVDLIKYSATVPVIPQSIVFIQDSGGITQNFAEILIAGPDFACQEIIKINNAGAII